MDVLFLTDKEDPVLRSAFDYFSTLADCRYAVNGEPVGEASVIVANHPISRPPGDVIFYATGGAADFTSIAARRNTLSWLRECNNVVCCSYQLAKQFHDLYRIKAVVQYPYAPRRQGSPCRVLYSPGFGLAGIREGIPSEEFQECRTAGDLLVAKLYLAAFVSPFDLAVASALGVPTVLEGQPELREFLGEGDLALGPQPPHLKLHAVKKLLKECQSKTPSDKYGNMAALEDKIKQALARRPPSQGQAHMTRPGIVLTPPTVVGRTRGRTTKVRPMTPPAQVLQATPTSPKTMFITGGIAGISGYDNFVYEITKGLRSTGVDVRINAHCPVRYDICPSFQDIHVSKPPDAWEIIIVPPCGLDRWSPGRHSIIYTMWETDTLEKSWVEEMNKAAFVVVPSQWAADCFRRCGVTRPIHKIPLGYDPLIFNPMPGWPPVCTFGTAAALTAGGLRKNIDKVITCFQRAFEGVADVRLKVKVTPSCHLQSVHDSRVEIVRTMLPPAQLANWYRSISAFVNCSYAEGFGLHLLEAMACGRPLLSTRYSAVAEYFDDLVGYTAAHRIIPASGGAYSGHWAAPVEDSVIEQMRRVYADTSLAQEKGRQAFLRARQFTWKTTGERLLRLLSEQSVIKV